MEKYKKWNLKWKNYIKTKRLRLLFKVPNKTLHFLLNLEIIEVNFYKEIHTNPYYVYEVIVLYEEKKYIFRKIKYENQHVFETFSSWLHLKQIKSSNVMGLKRIEQSFKVTHEEASYIEQVLNDFDFFAMIDDICQKDD